MSQSGMNYGKHARILFPQFSIFAVLIMCMCQECWDRADLAYARLGRRGCLWLRGLVPVWRARGSANSEHGINGGQTMRTHHLHITKMCSYPHRNQAERQAQVRSKRPIQLFNSNHSFERATGPHTRTGNECWAKCSPAALEADQKKKPKLNPQIPRCQHPRRARLRRPAA